MLGFQTRVKTLEGLKPFLKKSFIFVELDLYTIVLDDKLGNLCHSGKIQLTWKKSKIYIDCGRMRPTEMEESRDAHLKVKFCVGGWCGVRVKRVG